MESCPHLKPKIVCAVCCRALDHVPVFYCPQKHSCCQNCFKEVKYSLKAGDQQSACPLCRISGQFTPSRTRIKPGIGRPYRYNVNNTLPVTTYSYSRNYQDFCTPSTSSVRQDEEKIFETLIGMSKEKFYKSQTACAMKNSHNKKSTRKSRFTALMVTPSSTKRPFRCPHKPCHKTVAVAQFVNHFKSEHKDVPHYPVERGRELLLSCNVTLIEYNFHFCLAMITVYEVNRVDYLKKGSSESVIRTCSKFCQKIPIGTFWLMVSAFSEPHSTTVHQCLFWLFTNSEEVHKCTIELASAEDTVSLSTYCRVSRVLDNDFANIKRKLQGLIVTKSSLKSLLREGELLNVRIIIH